MSSKVRITVAFLAGIVLAFVWGLYYVIYSAVGFELTLALAFLVPSVVMVAGLIGIEWYLRRGRRARKVSEL